MRKIWCLSILFLSISAFSQDSLRSSFRLPSKPFLTQEIAKKLLAYAEGEAVKNNWKLSIAILDDAGQLLAFTRMDGSPNSSVALSQAKAASAVSFRTDGKNFKEKLESGQQVILAVPGAVPLDGGYGLYYDGQIVGAIGVSGSSGANDGIVAKAVADLLTGVKGK